MLERILGAAFRRLIDPLGRGLAAVGLSANTITVIGSFVSIGAAYVIATGHHVTACLAVLGGALFDTLDGVVAKVTNTKSKRGAFLDSTFDRLSDAAMFVGIMWRFLDQTALWSVTVGGVESDPVVAYDGTVFRGVGLALAALILSFMISYVRARAEALGFSAKVGVAERPERIILVAVGLLIDQLVWLLALLVVLSLVTLVWRIVHVWKQASAAEAP